MSEMNIETEEFEPEDTEEAVYMGNDGTGIQWLRRLAEGDGGWRRLAGMIVGLVGGVLIITGGFLFYEQQNNYASSKPIVTYAIDTPALMLGVAIIIGLLLAWWWRNSYAGCIICLIAAGYTLYTRSGLASPGNGAGVGAYLVYGGALLALTGGLIMLAERKAEVASELDWQDARFASLERVTTAMLEVWDEADRMKETMLKGESVDPSSFDHAAAEAEKRFLVHREIFEE